MARNYMIEMIPKLCQQCQNKTYMLIRSKEELDSEYVCKDCLEINTKEPKLELSQTEEEILHEQTETISEVS